VKRNTSATEIQLSIIPKKVMHAKCH